ncbi:hypothetical protein [Brucella anthropi]|uniref:hypothetical protein n=1 Tax=Brucella anthropi TaxID=529 RepID=UPI00028874B2|nr:hypothetical protein [Brucella anthropi]
MPDPVVLAEAAWQDILGLQQQHFAAVMRGDMDGAEDIRRRMHDMLDVHLDHRAEAVVKAVMQSGD